MSTTNIRIDSSSDVPIRQQLTDAQNALNVSVLGSGLVFVAAASWGARPLAVEGTPSAVS